MKALSWRADRSRRVAHDWQGEKVRAVELEDRAVELKGRALSDGWGGLRWRCAGSVGREAVIGLQKGQRHFTCTVSVESVESC